MYKAVNIPLSDNDRQCDIEISNVINNIFKSAVQNQGNVYTIHGPLSEHKNKDKFPNINQCYQENVKDLYCESGDIIHIDPFIMRSNGLISIIFSGLHNNIITIHGKLNHILIRKSRNLDLNIEHGTISGIDILWCKNIKFEIPRHNFTNIEYGESIYFQGVIDDISQLHISKSYDIKIYKLSFPVNPFISAIFTSKGCYYNNQCKIPNMILFNYSA